MRLLTASALVLAAVSAWSPVASSGSSAHVERRAALEANVVHEINRVRVAHALRPLRVSPSLRTAARGHTHAMIAHGFFGHDSLDGTAFSVRIKRHYTSRGWATWSVGEALLSTSGMRIVRPTVVVDAWLRSPSHREIVLSPAWRDVGIGVLYAPTAPGAFEGAEAVVVTADFGLRDGRADLP
ncbi:MAG TPA: CAP domain-containing protein [Gaiellaceae bacterium]|jgi:uncharacterized protein YkwD|nr:CAP domain-containing protein [Gaiellaceae bacterium]